MWVVRKLVTVKDITEKKAYSVQVYKLLNLASLTCCRVTIVNTETAAVRERVVYNYSDAETLYNTFRPYGCVVNEGAVEMITFVVVDDLSLQFLDYVDTVAEVRLRDREQVVKQYWPKLQTGLTFDSFTALDKEKSLFHYSSLYKGLKGGCTLLYAISCMSFGWYLDTFLLYMRRIKNMNIRFEGVEVYRVSFSDIEQAKRLIGKIALLGENPVTHRG